VFHQMVQGVFEAAREYLLLEADRNKSILGQVDGFVARHPTLP